MWHLGIQVELASWQIACSTDELGILSDVLSDGGRCGRFIEQVDDIISDDDAVVDRAQPTRHDDSATACVIQASDLLGKFSADGEPFEFGSKARP